MPGGVNSSTRLNRAIGTPFFARRAEGGYVWDIEVDFDKLVQIDPQLGDMSLILEDADVGGAPTKLTVFGGFTLKKPAHLMKFLKHTILGSVTLFASYALPKFADIPIAERA